ncbi:MAG TPA: protein kinase [Gemmataceae bacterium]|nr:protein kinase [Gemmataceae bacterium]
MTEPLLPEESIFARALEVPAGERAAFLDRECGADSLLRAEVESLLRADRTGDLLDLPDAPAATRGDPGPAPGTVIAGRYKLLEEIGEGGFGVVYLAEQTRPVCRKVALKVLKPGMDTRQVVARFLAERQALALMDHPHIAQVFDGGTTREGRPYFVMELVRGIPITDYCDQNRLALPARLELFARVCQAVQHAHQKGVIHRDLKPSNVMVTLHDGAAVPKVIDFGVAKALGRRLTDRTLFTGLAQMVGTPLYMSPEQAEPTGLDVDTRSDIYSLGVLLYELLTGTTPFDGDRLRTVGYDELRRIIREEEPARPSSRVSTLDLAATTLSANRRQDPRRLRRALRGELDWVVMKCLEKDRSRRYETADALAKDVERYLADEPVQACPPSAGYRLRKFARRNKRALSAVTVMALAMLLAVGGIGWAVRDRAARKAEEDREVDRMLQDAARLRDARKWVEAREAVKRIEWLVADGRREPERQRLRAIAADLELVTALEEIRLRPTTSDWPRGYAKVIDRDYAAAFRDYGIDVETLDPAEAARRIRDAAIREDLINALDAWSWVRHRYVHALVSSPEEMSAFKSKEHPRGEARLTVVVTLADPDDWRTQLRDSAALGDRSALEKLANRPEAGVQGPSTLLLLVRALKNAGAQDKALEALYGAQRRYPTDVTLNLDLADHLSYVSRPSRCEEAIGFVRAALSALPQHPNLHIRLGDLLRIAGRPDQAAAAYQSALQHASAYPRVQAQTHQRLGVLLVAQGAWRDAEAAYRRAISLDPGQATWRVGLANVYRGTREWDKAVAALEEELRLGPDRGDGRYELAWLLTNRPDVEHRDFDRAIELASWLTAKWPNSFDGWHALGVARLRAGDLSGAITALEKANHLSGGGGPYEWFFQAMAHWHLNDPLKARHWYDRAARWMTDNPKWLVDNPVKKEELQRFQAEAATLLGVDDSPRPATEAGPSKKP